MVSHIDECGSKFYHVGSPKKKALISCFNVPQLIHNRSRSASWSEDDLSCLWPDTRKVFGERWWRCRGGGAEGSPYVYDVADVMVLIPSLGVGGLHLCLGENAATKGLASGGQVRERVAGSSNCGQSVDTDDDIWHTWTVPGRRAQPEDPCWQLRGGVDIWDCDILDLDCVIGTEEVDKMFPYGALVFQVLSRYHHSVCSCQSERACVRLDLYFSVSGRRWPFGVDSSRFAPNRFCTLMP